MGETGLLTCSYSTIEGYKPRLTFLERHGRRRQGGDAVPPVGGFTRLGVNSKRLAAWNLMASSYVHTRLLIRGGRCHPEALRSVGLKAIDGILSLDAAVARFGGVRRPGGSFNDQGSPLHG